MALNPDKIVFLTNQIIKADIRSFSSSVKQLFNYIDKEVKDNPIYDKFELERKKWENWPGLEQFSFQSWKIPDNFEDSKSLSYDIYRSVAEQEDDGDKLSYALFSYSKLDENIAKTNETFMGYFNEALIEIINANPEIDILPPKKIKGKIVFIIHGHDNELKQETQILLMKAGVNSVVLHELPDKGRSIVDKLIDETNQAAYAIALLTPDDLTNVGNKRARQNVILEIGYFIGKIGKERIRMVIKDNVEIPSDMQGVLYERFDKDGAWKIKLLKEMQAVGIYVDIENFVKSF